MALSHDTQTADSSPDVAQPKEQAAPDARAMVARSGGDPHAIATLVQTNPGAKHAIMTMLQQTFGNSMVRTVVDLLATPDKPTPSSAPRTGPMHVKVDGLNVRRTAHKTADNVVGMLNHHDVVEASGSEGEWVKIEFHGQPAFVFGHYVEPTVAKTHAPAAAAPAAEHHASTPEAASTPAAPVAAAPTATPAPVPVAATPTAAAPAPAPIAATPVSVSVAQHHDVPVAAATDGHIAPAAHVEAKKADEKPADKDKTKKKAPPSGYSISAGGATHAVLTRLANEGRLKISPSQIAQLDAASQIESGGKIGAVDTTDDMVVSMGFFQFVLGHKSIEQLMHMAPAAFAKHGLELDPAKTYAFASHPHQIKGVENYDDLRGAEWGNKFLAASLDDDIIIATAQLALKEAAHVETITTQAGGKGDFFNDDTARAWLLELHNNRPAYTQVAVEKAVAAGARDAKDRDKFLDILAAAIEDSYGPEGVTTYHRAKAEAKNKNLTPDQDKDLLHKHVAAARLKGTHITQRISRHLALPMLEPIIGPAPHDEKAAPVAAAPTAADAKAVTASVAPAPAVAAPVTAAPAAAPTQGHQAAVSHADTHATANTHAAATPAPHADDHARPQAPAAFDPLDPEYAMTLGQAEAGVLSVDQATAQFAAFDRVVHNGAASVRGEQLVDKLRTEIVAATMKKSQQAAPPPATVAAVTTAPPAVQPHAVQHAGAATFETIQHTHVEINHDDEGKVLSDIRAFGQQFDPHWLIQVQQKLQVGDATGAFNTETLRAMRDTAGEKLTAKKITSHAYLDSLGTKLGVPGDPFRPEVTGIGHDEIDHTKTDPADIAAQAAGYADYHTYRTTALKGVTFLDVDLKQGASDGKAHPLLASRIAAAEAYLVQRFGSKEAAIKGTGWSKKAGAAYSATDGEAHDPSNPKSHMHTMGMAMDIDPNVNPYTMPKGDGAAADWITWFYTTGFELGHRLGFGGDALNLDSLIAEGKGMSSEELHEHMLASSKSFARTVELSEKSDEEIKAAMLNGKPPYKDGGGAKDIPNLIEKWFHPAKKIYHDAKGGRKFHETMTESKELIVALRDAAGLMWGGTEMSAGQNGDFMHFDTRNDSLGHKVYQAGYDAQQDRKHHADAAKTKDATKK